MDLVKSLGERIYEELSPAKDGFDHLVQNIATYKKLYDEDQIRQPILKEIRADSNTDDLLAKYQLQLTQLRYMNNECVRLANMSSTRMSTVQQRLNEEWENVSRLSEAAKQCIQVSGQLDSLNRQVHDLHHSFLQTQLATEALERLLRTNSALPQ